MKKVNLLIVTSNLWIGGAETIIANLCRLIDRDRFNVSICCLVEIGEVGEELIDEGYDVFSLTPSKSEKVNYLTFLQLLSVIKAKKIDIIHCHCTHSLIDTSLCKIFNRRVKSINTFHYGNYPHYDNKKYLFLEKLASKLIDIHIAVGENQRLQIEKTFSIKRITTIRNGVSNINAEKAPPKILDPILKKKKVVIGAINTLIEQKGVTYLIDVAKALKDQQINVVFVVVGDGPLRESLKQKTIDLGLEDDVFFLGWVKDAASVIMPFIDIFFQPSLWEAMSVVVLEAMISEKPVVVSEVGENSYVVDDGVNGFIFQPKDVNAMLCHLKTLVNTPTLRVTMGEIAKNKVVNELNIETMVKNHEDLYQSLM